MAYTPSQMPAISTVEDLRRYVESELQRLVSMTEITDEIRFALRYSAPTGPVEGMIVFADGTTWNPGSGKGLYEYRGGAWVKL